MPELWNDPTPERLSAVFGALPGRFLVLRARDHTIVAVSDGYLSTTGLQREELQGRTLQGALAGTSETTRTDTARAIDARAIEQSLARVAATGRVDRVALARYPMFRDAARGAGRNWVAVHTPVHGPTGDLELVVHSLEDAPEPDQRTPTIEATAPHDLRSPAAHVGAVSVQPDVETRLVEQEINLRLAERLLGLGSWRLDLSSGVLSWSDAVHAMFGLTREAFPNSLRGYLEIMHPEDREPVATAFRAFLASTESAFHFAHRVMRPDGAVVYIQGGGERAHTDGSAALIGVVQDVTAPHLAAEHLESALSQLRVAGQIAQLGGWRYDVREEKLAWSPETAAIHEIDAGFSPSVDSGIGFYAPEYQAAIREAFTRCVEAGESFDELLEIVTARGNRKWVRTIGEAERDASGRIVAVQGAFQDVSELVAARSLSRQLTHQLVNTLENMDEGFLLLSPVLEIRYVNAEAERLLRRRRDELIGRMIWDEFPEGRDTPAGEMYPEAIATGTPGVAEFYYPPLEVWFSVNAYPVPEGLAVYFRDITRQRERDQQVQLLEVAVNRLSDIVIITEAEPIDEPDGPRIVYVNDAFVRRTGYTRAEAIGRTPRFLQGPGTDPAVLARIRTALEAWQPVRAELLNYARDGTPLWLEIDIVPLADATGWFTHWVAVERDVTDRKQAEAAIRLNEERFRLISMATNDVIRDWDLTLGVLWWNDAVRTLFGFEALANAAAAPASWTDGIHPEDRARVVASMQAFIDGTDNNWSAEYRFIGADGRVLTIMDRAHAIRDVNGRALRILGSMMDMTARRTVEDQLRQAQKLEAIGQLTGGVAHDFNNLLTVILGNAELLSEQLRDREQLRSLAEVTAAAAERGAALTGRLLAFARRQALEPRLIDLNEQIAGMESLLRRALVEDIEIHIVRAGGLWSVEVDPSQMEVALLNLAINARDAMPRGGKLTIETANAAFDEPYASQHTEVDPGEYVMVSVSDTGMGMQPDVLARAFEPFFTTKPVGKGSGLGLSMVYGFVKQSRGHVNIYSEPGEGTAVKLYFPRARTGAAAEAGTSGDAGVPGGTEHILVVEDDRLVREHLVRQLEGLGYRVSSAGAGPEALDLLNDLMRVDLLLTDIVMPGGLNGRELAERAVQLRPGLKVLFTSGYTENAIVHHGRLDPGVHLLSKPYRRAELAGKVRRALDA